MNAVGQGNAAYTAQQMRFLGIPSAAALPENQNQLFYHQACEAKTSVNTDSGLTYNNVSAPRKRSRDDFNQFHPVQSNFAAQQKNGNHLSHLPPLAGDDFLPQIQQYQFEIDSIISQHVSIRFNRFLFPYEHLRKKSYLIPNSHQSADEEDKI